VYAFDALAEGADETTGPIAMAGDSAGGGIALAAAQWLTARGTHRPAALALLSPWANPGVAAERHRDLVVNRSWGLACAAAYLGDADPADPRFAPLLGKLDGLPPTYLFVSTRELLHSQCTELAASLRGAGVPLQYVQSPTLWHAAQAQAGLVRPAAESLMDVARFLAPIW
jgi:monoterpene epsilon-lactone hydrolase